MAEIIEKERAYFPIKKALSSRFSSPQYATCPFPLSGQRIEGSIIISTEERARDYSLISQSEFAVFLYLRAGIMSDPSWRNMRISIRFA